VAGKRKSLGPQERRAIRAEWIRAVPAEEPSEFRPFDHRFAPAIASAGRGMSGASAPV